MQCQLVSRSSHTIPIGMSVSSSLNFCSSIIQKKEKEMWIVVTLNLRECSCITSSHCRVLWVGADYRCNIRTYLLKDLFLERYGLAELGYDIISLFSCIFMGLCINFQTWSVQQVKGAKALIYLPWKFTIYLYEPKICQMLGYGTLTQM